MQILSRWRWCAYLAILSLVVSGCAAPRAEVQVGTDDIGSGRIAAAARVVF